jgi:hypothetical protein
MPLPEGRRALTDKDMVILLHDMARTVGQFGAANLKEEELREIADRFNELAKAASEAQHRAVQG